MGHPRLLLDTHALLWWQSDDPRLAPPARAQIAEGEVFVSAASIWEAAIRRAAGRLEAPEDLCAFVLREAFSELPIGFDHAAAAAALPPHHADPFDRMLVAQAQLEGLAIVTSDPLIARYAVAVMPAS